MYAFRCLKRTNRDILIVIIVNMQVSEAFLFITDLGRMTSDTDGLTSGVSFQRTYLFSVL